MRNRLNKDDAGFTLIELMVVVLIIAILVAIAVPTFLGQRARAQDRAAQSDVRNALSTEKTYYTDAQEFTATYTDLQAIEPNLFGADAASSRVKVTASADGTTVCLSAESGSGHFFGIREVDTTGTEYGNHTADPCAALGAKTAGSTWNADSTVGWTKP
jgi:type IV pilus assembly protein PilA